MPSRSVQESPHDAAWAYGEIRRLFDAMHALPDLSEVLVKEGSWLAREDAIVDYDPPSTQVVFLVGVARDHLETLHRGLVDPDGGLPTMAGYTLMRAALEASCTAIWLRCSGKLNVRLARALWSIVNARDDTEKLARRLNIANAAGYARMRKRVDGIIESRRDLKPALLERTYTTTDVINEAQKFVPSGYMTALEAWQACSGITHGNRSSTLMFLEREPVRTNGKITDYRITSSVLVTAMILSLAVTAMQVATAKFIEDATRVS